MRRSFKDCIQEWELDFDGWSDPPPMLDPNTPPPLPRAHHRDRFRRIVPDNPDRDKAMTRFIESVDRSVLEYALGQDEKYLGFLRALYSSDYAKFSFNKIASKFGIVLHELQALYTDAKRHMGLLRMSNNLDQVMEDISIDALSTTKCCSRCDGYGQLSELDANEQEIIRQCPICEGDGRIRVSGDKDARGQMLEAMKIIGRAPTVAIQQNFGGAAHMEDQMALTQRIVSK